MEHTNEFLRGMFAAYMGCEVTTKYDEDGRTYKTVGISFDEGNLQVETSKGDTDWWNIPICKPTLTPLSEITDEDAVEVARIMKIPQFERAKLFGCDEDNYYTIGRHIKKEIVETCSDDGFYLQGAVIDYLRFKKYDCGYMHIPSLITAGLAIKKTI